MRWCRRHTPQTCRLETRSSMSIGSWQWKGPNERNGRGQESLAVQRSRYCWACFSSLRTHMENMQHGPVSFVSQDLSPSSGYLCTMTPSDVGKISESWTGELVWQLYDLGKAAKDVSSSHLFNTVLPQCLHFRAIPFPQLWGCSITRSSFLFSHYDTSINKMRNHPCIEGIPHSRSLAFWSSGLHIRPYFGLLGEGIFSGQAGANLRAFMSLTGCYLDFTNRRTSPKLLSLWDPHPASNTI